MCIIGKKLNYKSLQIKLVLCNLDPEKKSNSQEEL